MADKRKKIVIEGQDAGFSSMLNKLRRESKDISKEMLADAKRYEMSGKESMSFLEDQIKAIERRNKLEAEGRRFQEIEKYTPKINQATNKKERKAVEEELSSRLAQIDRETGQDQMQTRLLREISETLKEEARDEINENPESVQRAIRAAERNDFAGLSPEETAKLKYQRDLTQSPDEGGSVSNFAQVIGAGVVRDIGGLVAQLPNAGSGLDLLTPFASVAGTTAGAGVGATVGFGAGALNSGTSGTAAGRGAIEGAALGSEIGKQIGQFAGQALTRHLNEQEQYNRTRFQLMNLTGESISQPSLTEYGISAAEGLGVMEQGTRQAGRSISQSEVEDMISVRSRGLTTEIAAQFFGAERTGGGKGSNEMARLIGVLEEIPTINRVIYSEIASNQMNLMQTMRQTRDEVSSEESLRMLMSFDKAGGQFAAENPLSLQNVQSVMQSMSDPQNDFVQARQFGILREMFPEASFVDLKDKMQNPTTEIMKAFLSDKGMEGLSEDQKTLAISEYTSGNIQQARSLKDFELADVDKFAEMDTLSSDARTNTATFQKQEARIKDAFLTGAVEGLKQVTVEFGDTLKMIRDEEMKKLDMENLINNQLKKAAEKMEKAADKWNKEGYIKSSGLGASTAIPKVPASYYDMKNGARNNKN